METAIKDFNIEEITIESVHSAMENGELTSYELVQFYLDRIEKLDKTNMSINSIIMINPDALQIAKELDDKFEQIGFTGPLHGIPVLIKDNIDVENMPTTAGSLSLEGVISREDAFLVKRLKEAGAIILAKTNLHEFAVWGETISSILGQTLNPYDLTRTPGGSSGGTGASVAMNFGMVGIGTDTVNSIRSPASACNLVGFRPTLGLVSRSGIVPYSLNQDTAGPITRTVEDAVKVLDVISGYDIKDSITAWSKDKVEESYRDFLNPKGLNGKNIGVIKSFFGKEEIHREVNEIIYKSIEDMKKLGANIVYIEENIDSNKLIKEVSIHLYDLKAHLNLYLSKLGNRSKVHSLDDILKSSKYHKGIEENLIKASNLDMEMIEYNKRIIKKLELKNYLMNIMAEYNIDAFIYPHQKIPAVKIGNTQDERNGVISSVTGFPAIVVPAGFTKPDENAPLGVPVGLEILAKEWREDILIEIAYAYEQYTNHRKNPICISVDDI